MHQVLWFCMHGLVGHNAPELRNEMKRESITMYSLAFPQSWGVHCCVYFLSSFSSFMRVVNVNYIFLFLNLKIYHGFRSYNYSITIILKLNYVVTKLPLSSFYRHLIEWISMSYLKSLAYIFQNIEYKYVMPFTFLYHTHSSNILVT